MNLPIWAPPARNRPKAAVLLLFGVEEEEESMVHRFRMFQSFHDFAVKLRQCKPRNAD